MLAERGEGGGGSGLGVNLRLTQQLGKTGPAQYDACVNYAFLFQCTEK